MPRPAVALLGWISIVPLVAATHAREVRPEALIDAAMEYEDPAAGPIVLFFKGNRYVRYDILRNRVTGRGQIQELFRGYSERRIERIDAATVLDMGAGVVPHRLGWTPEGSRGYLPPPPGTAYLTATMLLVSRGYCFLYTIDWDMNLTYNPTRGPGVGVTLVWQGFQQQNPLYEAFPHNSYNAAYLAPKSPGDRERVHLLNPVEYTRVEQSSACYRGQNKNAEVHSMARAYPGLPFPGVDAAYVDSWTFRERKAVLHDLSQDLRKDGGFEGAEYHFNEYYLEDNPQLYIFFGDSYARYDLRQNKFVGGVNSIAAGFPGVLEGLGTR